MSRAVGVGLSYRALGRPGAGPARVRGRTWGRGAGLGGGGQVQWGRGDAPFVAGGNGGRSQE